MNSSPGTKASDYFSLITFSHTLFALPFAVIGFFLGNRLSGASFSAEKLFFVILCMVFARSAAMAFNRYIDRDIDLLNERTAHREIPKGIIQPYAALLFVVINCLLFIMTTFFINRLCFYLSPLALLIILGYSFTKRFTALCHFILATGLALAPIGAYMAVTGIFSGLPLLFSFVVFCWVSGFDIIYALQDEAFDKQNNLKSIPVIFGSKKSLLLSFMLHVFSALFIILAGLTFSFGIWYWIGAAFFIALLAFQHTVVKPDDLSRVNLAFFTLNGIASVVFSAFVVIDISVA